MRHYPAKVVGVRYEGRDKYVRKNVRFGDKVRFVTEPDNPHGSNAVAVFHNSFCIGYLPSECTWLKESIAEGDLHDITVTDFTYNDAGELAVVRLDVGVEDQRPEPPPPTTGQLAVSALENELKVLICIAKSDERLVRAERELLLRYAEERCRDKSLQFDHDTLAHVERWIRKQSPTQSEMRLCVHRVAIESREALEAIFQVSEIIAEVPNRNESEAHQLSSEARSIVLEYLRSS